MVPRLYKYLSISSADAVLSNASLKWSTPEALNDPFDIQVAPSFSLDGTAVAARTIELIVSRFESQRPLGNVLGLIFEAVKLNGHVLSKDFLKNNFNGLFEEAISTLQNGIPEFSKPLMADLLKSKVLCLSHRPNIPLMWSHYAESHRGVVLGFEPSENNDTALKLAKPVIYSSVPPDFYTVEDLALILAGEQLPSVQEVIDRIVYFKPDDWKYEEEWRVVDPYGRERNASFEISPFYPSDLRSVVFGLKADPENVKKWRQMANKINSSVEFFTCSKSGLGIELLKFDN